VLIATSGAKESFNPEAPRLHNQAARKPRPEGFDSMRKSQQIMTIEKVTITSGDGENTI
jgi:hypothetical protein